MRTSRYQHDNVVFLANYFTFSKFPYCEDVASCQYFQKVHVSLSHSTIKKPRMPARANVLVLMTVVFMSRNPGDKSFEMIHTGWFEHCHGIVISLCVVSSIWGITTHVHIINHRINKKSGKYEWEAIECQAATLCWTGNKQLQGHSSFDTTVRQWRFHQVIRIF